MKILLVACILIVLAAGPAFGAIVTFDTDTTPPVTVDGALTATWNAGQYWDVSGVGGRWAGAIITHNFGDVTAMPQLTLDLKGPFSGDNNEGVRVVLVGGGGSYASPYLNTPDTPNWTTYTVDMIEGNWASWGGTWNGMLGDVTDVALYHWPLAASGTSSFDNVGFVPEPISLSLLGVGGLALLRRRRK